MYNKIILEIVHRENNRIPLHKSSSQHSDNKSLNQLSRKNVFGSTNHNSITANKTLNLPFNLNICTYT